MAGGALGGRTSGEVEIGFAARPDGTRLAHLYQASPLRALFPRPAPGDVPLAVVSNTAGGVVGGDRLRVDLALGAGARALCTGQAAEKIYRSLGPVSAIDARLRVGDDAWLEWLPQEAILFDGARLRRSLAIDADPRARVLAGEALVFGRAARGERFTQGFLDERWRVGIGGRLVWADALRIDDDPQRVLAAPAGFAGSRALATVVYLGADAPGRLGLARDLLVGAASRCGATVVNGVLVVRFLAEDGAAMRADLGRFWCGFRAAVAGLPGVLPRLWHI